MSQDKLPPLREVIARYDLAARKNLGQNFILDLNLTGRIARTAGDLSGCPVVEIGPGPGGLTRALLAEQARQLILIEKDERCLPALQDIGKAYPDKLSIHHQDALKTDLFEIACQQPVKIVANLPYNIATPLLLKWLGKHHENPHILSMTLMFQKEVAQRLVAKPGNKAYGRLSVICQYMCNARLVFSVSRSAFSPPPKVESAIVHLIPYHQPENNQTDKQASPSPYAEILLSRLERITASAFGKRRKMLRSSLKSLVPATEQQLEKLGIRPTARAEELSVAEYCQLAKHLHLVD